LREENPVRSISIEKGGSTIRRATLECLSLSRLGVDFSHRKYAIEGQDEDRSPDKEEKGSPC